MRAGIDIGPIGYQLNHAIALRIDPVKLLDVFAVHFRSMRLHRQAARAGAFEESITKWDAEDAEHGQ